MVKLPVSSVIFGADALETETLYITADRRPTYTIENHTGSPAIYSMEDAPNGWFFHIQANEWQEDSPSAYTADITFSDGSTSTSKLSITTRESPSGMLYFLNDYLTFSPSSETKRVYFKVIGLKNGTNVKAEFTDNGTISVVGTSTLTSITDDSYTGYLDITVNENQGSFRSGILWITATDTENNEMRRDLQVIQPSLKVFPCWKEALYSIKAPDGYAEYSLVDTDKNKTIYRGRAVAFSSSSVEIDVARIVRPLLHSSYGLDFGDEIIADEDASINFSLNINGTPVQYYMAYDGYSYDSGLVEDRSRCLNDLIQPRIAKGQPYTLSMLNTGDDKATINGYEYDVPTGVSHYGYYLEDGENQISIKVGSSEYTLEAEGWCGRYIIFYINANGGCDWLLTEGNDTTTDTIANGTMTHPYYNVSNAFGKSQYLKTITRKTLVHTGWLTDIESAKMHNLLESARVWLFDMEENIIHPAMIADTSMTYKTFANQGRQLVSYDINLEWSHTFERR
mgnify:CR=1 FL=1